MLDSRLNALVLANINQKIIHTIEMGIFINKNLIYIIINYVMFIIYFLIYSYSLLYKLNIINCILKG